MDVTNLDADVANQELSSFPGDCGQLRSDLQLAQSAPPIPSPPEDALWTGALGDFTQAINECASAVNDHDTSEIAEAAQNTSKGGASLATLASRINASP